MSWLGRLLGRSSAAYALERHQNAFYRFLDSLRAPVLTEVVPLTFQPQRRRSDLKKLRDLDRGP